MKVCAAWNVVLGEDGSPTRRVGTKLEMLRAHFGVGLASRNARQHVDRDLRPRDFVESGCGWGIKEHSRVCVCVCVWCEDLCLPAGGASQESKREPSVTRLT